MENSTEFTDWRHVRSGDLPDTDCAMQGCGDVAVASWLGTNGIWLHYCAYHDNLICKASREQR